MIPLKFMVPNNLAESIQSFFSNIMYCFINSHSDTFEIDSSSFEIFQTLFVLFEDFDYVRLFL